MTVLVIVTTIIVALYSGGLDYIFTAALQTALNR
ncbi:MAG: hypothetical protein UW88_C0017G0020 [Candidatus Collierbacteria bacterium GW2011_GWD2_45_10]|nr:MAG: hypothetical protein UW88_C0017G0020 [Candidatus Collierbacteria bacterium GW2011_GWD2_45_10]